MLSLIWDLPPTSLKLGPEEGHLWRFRIPEPTGEIPFDSILNEEERERARRFRFARDRQEFAFCRGVLRILLGKYLSAHPGEINFQYQAQGKPFVDSVSFNLSHSKGGGVLAFVGQGEVGVDLERIEEKTSWEKLAERYFSEAEVSFLQSFPPREKKEVFYQIWTLKEALIKGVGKGFSLPLKDFQVRWDSPQGEAVLKGLSGTHSLSSWKVYRLAVFSGYCGALAYSGEKRLWQGYDWDSV